MSMGYRTCKRCSVSRVNILCDLYHASFQLGDRKAKKDLRHLAELAVKRGYVHGADVLLPDLPEGEVRSICWNISSLLQDDDMARLGYRVGEKK